MRLHEIEIGFVYLIMIKNFKISKFLIIICYFVYVGGRAIISSIGEITKTPPR